MTKAKILIVEDEAIISQEIGVTLEDMGYEVVAKAIEGEEALKKAETDNPDIILMDIQLGGKMDGIEAAAVIKERFDIPVVFMTAFSDEQRIERAKLVHPYGYLIKPVQERDLRITIEMALYISKVDAERKQVEDALRESEERFRNFIDASPDASVILDSEFNIKEVKFLENYPLTREEVIGKHVLEVIPFLKETGRYDQYLEVMKTGKPFTQEDVVYSELIDKHSTVRAFKAGNCLGIIMTDTTERKQIEISLRQSERRFRKMIEKSPVPVIITDANQDIELFNDKFTELFGYTRNDVSTSEKWWKMAYPDEEYRLKVQQSWENAIKKAQINNTDIEMQEWELTIKDRSKRLCEFYMVPIDDFSLIIMNDITTRKEMEKNLISAKQEAESANRAKSQFLASMSHELRTPLNAILGFSQVLEIQKQGLLNEKQLEYINYIKEGGAHLLAMVNDILDLTKIETGKYELKIELFDIAEMLMRIPLTIQSLSDRKGIQVELDIPTDLGFLKGDETKIKQVIFNLLSNSVKFTESGNRIGINAEVERDNIKIEVWDEGIGIFEGNLDKIFNPFEQGIGGKSSSEMGTGLGLAISKRFVELHQGTITVTSKLGEGSRFIINLPGRISSGGQPPIESVIKQNKKSADFTKNVKILVTDDQKTNRELIAVALDVYQCDFAESGEEAITMASEKKYDLILMDIQMPGMDGTETMKQIRRNSHMHIPIIALTAFAMKGDEKKYLEAGFDDYFSKPINIDLLVKKIQKSLRKA